jgi:hypothetical protein
MIQVSHVTRIALLGSVGFLSMTAHAAGWYKINHYCKSLDEATVAQIRAWGADSSSVGINSSVDLKKYATILQARFGKPIASVQTPRISPSPVAAKVPMPSQVSSRSSSSSEAHNLYQIVEQEVKTHVPAMWAEFLDNADTDWEAQFNGTKSNDNKDLFFAVHILVQIQGVALKGMSRASYPWDEANVLIRKVNEGMGLDAAMNTQAHSFANPRTPSGKRSLEEYLAMLH